MRVSKIAVVWAAAVTLTACAGRTPAPVAIAQAQDPGMSCAAIAAESKANTEKIGDLGREKGWKVAQNITTGLAGFFIPVLWVGMDWQGAAGKEMTALEQRNEYLGTIAAERCQNNVALKS
jgi:hypothetical protein